MDKYFSKGSQLPISKCTKFNTWNFDFKLYEISRVKFIFWIISEFIKMYSTNRNIYKK